MTRPLIIAHRGASGYLPDHTLEAYQCAIAMGADFIEPDLVSTRDGVLVARHEPMLAQTTNVQDRADFASRKRTVQIDGVAVTDWFVADFSLGELRTLKARQPMPWRDQSHNDQFLIPTFDEIIALAKSAATNAGRAIGIAPEIKHPTWHATIGLPLEDRLLAALDGAGWNSQSAPVIVQCFETSSLRYLRARTGVRLLQLVDGGGMDDAGAMTLASDNLRPYDWTVTGDRRNWGDLLTAAGLAEVSEWADYISPWKRWLIPTRVATPADNAPYGASGGSPGEAPCGAPGDGGRIAMAPTGLVRDAHAAGLKVITWTLRSEPQFLAANYQGDPAQEIEALINLGVDGLFSDFPDVAVATRDALASRRGGIAPVNAAS